MRIVARWLTVDRRPLAETYSLPQTGERFLPGEQGQNRYEHLHRYLAASKLVRGKDVLDIASGEGYGAALYSRTARTVTGVDVSTEAILHARRTYYQENLRFLAGDCAAIPLADASVDVVTSFETIEHHERHDEMLSEVRRVLRPGGLLIISSPNRLVYSDEVGFTNPFHVKELYFDEFSALCRRFFSEVEMYGQVMGAASFLVPLGTNPLTSLSAFGSESERGSRGLSAPRYPMYFVAICSNERPKSKGSFASLFFDIDDDFFGRLTRPQVVRHEGWRQPVELQIVSETKALPAPEGDAARRVAETSEREVVQLLRAVHLQLNDLQGQYNELREAYDTERAHGLALNERCDELAASLSSREDAYGAEASRLNEELQSAAAIHADSATRIEKLEAEVIEARTALLRSEAQLRLERERAIDLTSRLESERRARQLAVENSVERNRKVSSLLEALSRCSGGAEQWRIVAEILREELAESLVAQAAARAELESILNSRSWRLTGALRGAKAAVVGTAQAVQP